MTYTTMAQLKRAHRAQGWKFFDNDTMKFWGSKVHGEVRGGKFFITSEDNYDRTARLFTIRCIDDAGMIDTVGEFQAHATLEDAISELVNVMAGAKA